jgi:hypothetical protein
MFQILKSRKFQSAALVLLAVALLALFFRGTDLRAIVENLAKADLRFIAAAVAVTMVTYLIRAIRWRVLLAPVGRPGLRACFITTTIGFMVNFLGPTGRLGEIARPYLLARREGFSASSTLATIFLERVLDLVTVVFLVGGWLWLGSAPGGAKSESAIQGLKVGGLVAFAAAGVGLVVMFAFARYRERAMALIQTLARWLPSRLEGVVLRFLEAFSEGFGVLMDGGNLARTGILSFALWLNIALGFWVGIRAFGIEIPYGGSFLVIGFLTVGVAVPTPGAVGGYHVMCSLALTLLFGVGESTAKAAALVSHAIAFVPVSVLGMVFFIREGLSFREVKTMESSG